MSMHETVEVTCPKCGKVSPFVIWSSINTQLDPEMKEKVRTGEAFLFTCPECGDQNSVDYGFLYHQMEDKIMIHYANSDENFEEMFKFYVDPPKSNGKVRNCDERAGYARCGGYGQVWYFIGWAYRCFSKLPSRRN